MSSKTSALGCGLDVGGTWAKAAIYVQGDLPLQAQCQHFVPSNSKLTRFWRMLMRQILGLYRWAETETDLRIPLKSGYVFFITFLSSRTHEALAKLTGLHVQEAGDHLHATGLTARKVLAGTDNTRLLYHDEMECLATSLAIVAQMPGECFTFQKFELHDPSGTFLNTMETVPALLKREDSFLAVSMGAGVSFLLCSSLGFRRVGGSSLGRSTFVGLCGLLTGEDDFDRALDLASRGDVAMVDVMVKDIFPCGEYPHGLQGDALASSFGKMVSQQNRLRAKPADLALSALVMCSMNVAAIAYLHAEAASAKHIAFTGSFLSRSDSSARRLVPGCGTSKEMYAHGHNLITLRALAYAVSFWSRGAQTAIFFKHDKYLGALGALCLGTPWLGATLGTELEARARL